MIYLTSDTHFNHINIVKYEPKSRPFKIVEEMNEKIIENWNAVVGPEDEIYVVGDFFMGTLEGIEPIIRRLNGKIHLIRGNHDGEGRIKKYKEFGIDVSDIKFLRYKGKFFILCHFPIVSEEFNQMVSKNNDECILLYGHIHSNAPSDFVNNSYHVGVDTNNLTPISIEDIFQKTLIK